MPAVPRAVLHPHTELTFSWDGKGRRSLFSQITQILWDGKGREEFIQITQIFSGWEGQGGVYSVRSLGFSWDGKGRGCLFSQIRRKLLEDDSVESSTQRNMQDKLGSDFVSCFHGKWKS